MAKKKVCVTYIGRENNVHDKLFVAALDKEFCVIEKYTENSANETLDEKSFENCNLIIAGPLTDAISFIPKSISIPILGISHGFDLNVESSDAHLRENIDRCSSIIADCEYIVELLRNDYQYTKDIYSMPFGCDYDYFSQANPAYSNELLILVTRNWFQVHGNPIIIEALEILFEKEIKINCTFIGDGPLLTDEIRDISKRNHVSSINFLGTMSKNDIRNEMLDKWIYISAAESDGTSISLLEAMSAGMICLVSDFPSNLEWVKHGCNGYLFERNNSTNLSELIQEVSSLSIDEMKIIGERARQTAKVRGNWMTNSETLLNASRKILLRVKSD